MVLVEQVRRQTRIPLSRTIPKPILPAGAEKSDLHRTHFAAWKLGTKGLYYLRTETSQRAENVAEKDFKRCTEGF